MERPERKKVGFLQQPLENERLKLENEEKRALVEGLRKKHDIGGSKNMYDRVKPEPEPQKENWFVKLWKS